VTTSNSAARSHDSARTGDLRVWAVIPAFNEESRIAAVVRGIAGAVAGIVVVDDGSSDATAHEAASAGAEVLRRAANGGKGAAIRAGLTAVLAHRCTHVLFIDGDGQHRPGDVPALVAAARDGVGVGVVVGERQFARGRMPRSRYYANVIGSRALSWFIGTEVRDTQSGFRLVNAEWLRDLPLTATGYEIETEMLIRLARRGASIVRIPVAAVYTDAPSKLRPLRDTTRTCFLAVKYRFLSRG
jgi:glycosyltransferase involved in cell wall biosynthesis